MSQDQDQYQSQVESKASDSERIAEPAATREAIQESCKSADDMIEEEEPNATGPLLTAYQRIHRLTQLADRHKKELRVARHEVRTARAELRVSES